MTLAELRQEVVDRGYDYLAASRIEGFVQRAYQSICARHPTWPFLETSTEGQAPILLSDLRSILSVKDTTTEETLTGIDRRTLEAMFEDLSETGTPEYWYLEGSTLKIFPVAEDNISIRYQRIPVPLTETSEPLVPAEWQYLIVELAVVPCLRDDDEYAEARALLLDTQQAIDTEMLPALMSRNLQNGEVLVRTGSPWDYL